MKKFIPSPRLLNNVLSYDATTGKFKWKERRPILFKAGNGGRMSRCTSWNKVWSGKPALNTVNDNDYLYGRIFNKNFYAHRVAWAMTYGVWPEQEIDHINGDRKDNRIENLRAVSRRRNMRNLKTRKNRVFSNIYFDKRHASWSVRVGGFHVASSKCFGKCMIARNKKLRERGFSQRHISA